MVLYMYSTCIIHDHRGEKPFGLLPKNKCSPLPYGLPPYGLTPATCMRQIQIPNSLAGWKETIYSTNCRYFGSVNRNEANAKCERT